jgi:hypothetical protein
MPPVPYPTAERLEVRVGKTPYVRFDKNDYSVPHTQVRKLLCIEATQAQVRVLCQATEVACHARSWDQGAVIEDPAHIQALRAHKQRAQGPQRLRTLKQAVPAVVPLLELWAARGLPLHPTLPRLERLLELYGQVELQAAIEQAHHIAAPDVHALQLLLDQRALLHQQPPPVTTPLPADSPLRGLHVQPHSLDSYDALHKEHDDEP